MGYSCPTATGQFSVAIHSVLKPGTKLSTKPTLADTTVLQTQSFGLALAGAWQGSGVTVEKGQKVFIRAPGSFQATPFNGTPAQFNPFRSRTR